MAAFEFLKIGNFKLLQYGSDLSKKSQIIQPSAQFYEYNNVVQWESIGKDNTAYYLQNCPALATIIQRKAKAFLNSKRNIIDLKNNNVLEDSKSQAVQSFLDNPNPLQSYSEFFTQLYTALDAYGWCFVLPMMPAGFKDRVSSMWIIPNEYINIELNNRYLNTTSFADQIKSVRFTYNGESTLLDKEALYLFRGSGMHTNNLLFPDSKLQPLKYPIQNIIKNYEARGTIAEKKGAIGILSNKSQDVSGQIPLREDDKRLLQEEYSRYGLSKKQWQLIITNSDLEYQSMTMPIRDMMLLEMEEADVITIANALDYPYELLGSAKGTTFANRDNAEKGLYQNSIIPDAFMIQTQLNDMLSLNDAGMNISFEYSHLPCFQDDEKLKAETRKVKVECAVIEFDANLITWNEMRISVGEPTVTGMDKYKYQLTEIYNNNNGNNTSTASAQ